jgi:hypothetical protein
LFVDFKVANKPFEVLFCLLPVGPDHLGLVLPGGHLHLVKEVGGVHLLQVKLVLIFVRDVYSKMLNAYLLVVEALAKGGEVKLAIPFGPAL